MFRVLCLFYRVVKKIILTAFFVTVVFSGYEIYKTRTQSYPFKIILLSDDYQWIRVVLENRTSSHIYFRRLDSPMLFIEPIARLHPLWRWRIYLYPYAGNELDDRNNHWEQALNERDRLIQTIQRLQQEMDVSESSTEKRSLEQDIDRNLEKIARLEQSLKNAGIEYKSYVHGAGSGRSLIQMLENIVDRILNRDG